MLLRVDAAKARHRLGWAPRLPLDEALGWTVEWFKTATDPSRARAVTLTQIEAFETREHVR